MRIIVALLCAIVALSVASAPAEAGKRVALVIGNSNYGKAGSLPNPARDAAAMGALFRRMGFDQVDVKTDLGQVELRRALREFSQSVRDADIAVVFYAGHGVEVAGTNYLIPVDVVLERDTDIEDEAVSLERVNRLIQPAQRLRLIILDACRENPFTPAMQRGATRAIGRGLAWVDVQTQDTMIAFAARPGTTVNDGSDANSPYTTALLRNLAIPGLDIRLAMGRVRDEVAAQTGRQQEPTFFTSLGGTEISLVPPADEPAAPASAQTTSEQDAATQAWVATRDTTSIVVLEEFVRRYGDSYYATLARGRIEELRNIQAATAVPAVTAPVAPPVERPQAPANPCGSGAMTASGEPCPSSAAEERAVLLVEDVQVKPTQVKKVEGTVKWRFERGSSPSEGVVHAVVEFPKLKLQLKFERNTEASLPASHTAELNFATPPDAPGGGVEGMGSIVLKTSENEVGAPALESSTVSVVYGLFLVGLTESKRDGNLQLLKNRPWFEIPITFANKQRALLSFEKGESGARVLNEAFAAWGD